VLKNDKLKEREKKREVEALLGNLADERFALLTNLGKKITDFSSEDALPSTGELNHIFTWRQGVLTTSYTVTIKLHCIHTSRVSEENIDEAYGINCHFEESSEEDGEDKHGEVCEDDGEEPEEGEEARLDTSIHAENVSQMGENIENNVKIQQNLFITHT
jgi:pre-mRNA-splicing helicase BRR2